MFVGSKKKALAQAKANAKRSGVCWTLFVPINSPVMTNQWWIQKGVSPIADLVVCPDGSAFTYKEWEEKEKVR